LFILGNKNSEKNRNQIVKNGTKVPVTRKVFNHDLKVVIMESNPKWGFSHEILGEK
jgi:hypothetical protein